MGISLEEYKDLIECRCKLQAVSRYFETSTFSLSADEYYRLTGIISSHREGEVKNIDSAGI